VIAEPQPGTRLGERFDLRSVAAQAPGYVEYRAFDAEIGVEVGLWWIRPTLVPDSARQDQLIGAAIEQRRLQVSHGRRLHGAGRAREGVWLSWQQAQAPGPAPARDTPAPLATVTRWIDAAAAALTALHQHGVIHGRLVPEDVVTVGGELRLAGAGLWHGVDRTAAGLAWRRWQGYVAPEVAAGGEITPATDAWSVAAIAATLIGGADDATEAMRVVRRRHPPLHELLENTIAGASEGRPIDLAGFAAAARKRATMPYLADDRSGPMRILAAAQPAPARAFGQRKAPAGPTEATAIGHASAAATKVDPDPAGARVAGAAASAPAMPQTFALPTPTVAPPAPVPQPQAIVIGPGRGMPLAAPTEAAPALRPPAAPPIAAPPPAAALRAPVPRAVTAPVGGFQAVSMKPKDDRTAPVTALPAPTAERGSARGKKVRLRNISEAGQRTFSVAPGAMGYLAPPREVAAAHRRMRNKRVAKIAVIAIVLVIAAIGGFVLATRM
jgi:hypothetical protein